MLAGLSLGMVALLVAAGLLLDRFLGEPRRWHPLVGFGNFSSRVEKALNRGGARRWRGLLAWLITVVPFVVLTAWLAETFSKEEAWQGAALHAVLLYFCVGLRSLGDHMLPIGRALAADDLAQARVLTARIVSRDTADATPADLAKASVESLLENGNDAVFGTLFWFIVAGAPGAVLFRLANTLDAMWGYRNARFQAFGCVAARIDDALNWVPARLTALSYTLLGKRRSAWRCWQSQAAAWPSPNAGPVMAAGAGALELLLGGTASYEGIIEMRPPLGAGRAAGAPDISRAWRLVMQTTLLWVGMLCCFAVIGRAIHA